MPFLLAEILNFQGSAHLMGVGSLSNTLKDIREERNLIQADLAEAIGSCSQTIGRIERGERNPSLEIAIRLAHYLKVPVEDIFQVED